MANKQPARKANRPATKKTKPKTAKKPTRPAKKAAKSTKRPAKKPAKRRPPKAKLSADPPPIQAGLTYEERERIRKASFAAARRSASSNIGEIPPIRPEFAELRKLCETDLVLWHQEVFRNSTGLKPFGKAQLESIETSRQGILDGGLLNILEPRGGGKTTRGTQNGVWGLCYGFRRFVGILGSDKVKAGELVDGFQLEVETNDTLLGMFPEIFYPLRMLEGKPQKAKSQHINGVPTNCVFQNGKVVFPTVEGSNANGSILCVKSVKNVRGLQHRTKTQGVLRPSLYILDDVQTDEGARSRNVVRKLLNLIRKGILFGGNYADNLAILNLATIIEPEDVPDQLASDLSWITVRYSFLLTPPKNEELWLGEYARIRQSYTIDANPVKTKLNKDAAAAAARNYFLANREPMEDGASVYWDWAFPWRAKPYADGRQLCVCALQHYYNTVIDHGIEVAACELQNRPIKIDTTSDELSKATEGDLKASIVSIPRFVVPLDHSRLITYADLHRNVFYFATVSKTGADQSNRHLVDLGTWPEQPDLNFAVESARNKIPDDAKYKGLGPKAMMRRALKDFIDWLLLRAARHYKSQNGNVFHLDEFRLDANWGPMEKVVKDVIRIHKQANRLWACHGIGLPASKASMNQWRKRTGEEKGDGWTKIRASSKAVQTLNIDTNQWKTETHHAITTPVECDGTLTLFDQEPFRYKMFFEHCTIENVQRVKKIRDCEEWQNPKGGQNHWFDCLVGAMVDWKEGDRVKSSSQERRGNNFNTGGLGF